MIYHQPPENFSPRFEVVSCLIEVYGQILLLHRQDGKLEGNKWGVPAGKMESGEEAVETLIREIREEIGLSILSEQLVYFDKVYVRYPDYDFIFHTFHTKLEVKPEVLLNEENKAFCWVTPQDALSMDLVLDEDDRIKMFYSI